LKWHEYVSVPAFAGDQTVPSTFFLRVPRVGVVGGGVDGGDAIDVVGTPAGIASAEGDAAHPNAAGVGVAILSSAIAGIVEAAVDMIGSQTKRKEQVAKWKSLTDFRYHATALIFERKLKTKHVLTVTLRIGLQELVMRSSIASYN